MFNFSNEDTIGKKNWYIHGRSLSSRKRDAILIVPAEVACQVLLLSLSLSNRLN